MACVSNVSNNLVNNKLIHSATLTALGIVVLLFYVNLAYSDPLNYFSQFKRRNVIRHRLVPTIPRSFDITAAASVYLSNEKSHGSSALSAHQPIQLPSRFRKSGSAKRAWKRKIATTHAESLLNLIYSVRQFCATPFSSAAKLITRWPSPLRGRVNWECSFRYKYKSKQQTNFPIKLRRRANRTHDRPEKAQRTDLVLAALLGRRTERTVVAARCKCAMGNFLPQII